MVNAVPRSVIPSNQAAYYSYVKTAAPDVVDYNEQAIPTEMITSILFEEVGGIELINIVRHDTIGGISIDYSLVGNIPEIDLMFNSNNIISGFENRDTYLNQFPIDIWHRLNGVSISEDGDLVIDLHTIEAGEEVEVQILTDGKIYVS